MNCEQAWPLVEAYFDRVLDVETAGQLESHLADCSACAIELQQMRSENEVYAGYEHSLEFDPALWNGIRSRIGAAGSERGFLSWLVDSFAAPRISIPVTIALVLLAVGVTARLMRTVDRTPQEITLGTANQPEDSGVEVEIGAANDKGKAIVQETSSVTERRRSGRVRVKRTQSPTPQQLVLEAETKYLAAIAILLRRVERENSLTPEARLRFEETLATIDRNIAATRLAVLKHPEDPVAVHYMLTAYARKVEVLREMTGY